ncbi:putative MFS transporter [Aspergillus nomiae NRRL 13137]|uniref:Putative MFS transporter n=1 Tax=Aspergillus nomiae NRRL (strain ATCC 15546 / NRRL 13137 / CBS 260.88 / M93) TaxID=1509407 RepID=A0A0L1IQQ7_ASPN3|nr:putative MFS transporter [Aspergillus nomiae NRRL 13137]KNG81814.1 putative MFS transporter [Aspergillus nomiae NRRL 13137]
MLLNGGKPLGYRWRSSNFFILSCVTLALFSENFLYSFIVPILQQMLEDRLHLDPSKTQTYTSAVFTSHALVCFFSGPIIAAWADSVPSRKGPLLVSLGGEIVGTIVVAAATSLPVLLFGRIIQGIAGNAAWIIGFATVADLVEDEQRSRVFTTTSMFFMSGLVVGPATSGILIKLVGYWPTWLTAIALLVFDMMMRLVMIESPLRLTRDVKETTSDPSISDETSDLLPGNSPGPCRQEDTPWQEGDPASCLSGTTESSTQSFYKVILSNPRALTALACHAFNALILVSFDTTLPLYVTRAFGWDSSRTSMMFMELQLPAILLSPFAGWMKDRIGTSGPTCLGFLATAFLLWVLGTCGPDGLPFIGSGERGQAVYMASMLGLGFARPLLTGCGVIEMTSVVAELQKTQPAIFGPNGGMSRAYSLTNMAWTSTMFLGPILTSTLTQTVGYYYMNFFLGKSPSSKLAICIVALTLWISQRFSP